MRIPTADGRKPAHSLEAIFDPRTVAVIGATDRPGSVGRTLLANLTASTPFAGRVFPVNVHRPSVLGLKAYSKISEVPERIDLAVIATPAETVPAIIVECGDAGVGGAVVVSAGFREVGPQGLRLEQEALKAAKGSGMRLIGPNCLGVMNSFAGLNASFAASMALSGNVAFLSQSGALCTAILDWSLRERVGFSAFASIGSMVDVGWGDLIDYFGADPHTRSILIYMESIGEARSFISAAREVALAKPIIVLKPGRTEAAARAAVSHTGALACSDDVIDAAFRRAGVLRVNSVAEMFYMAEVLARQPEPRGPRLTIVTNAGGPGVLATDALIKAGGEIATLSDASRQELDRLLPPHWSHSNPVDVLGDAGPDRYQKAIEVAVADPNGDGLLVILTPQAMSDPTGTAKAVARFANTPGKPVLTCWMGGDVVRPGVDELHRAGIPTFPFPDTAARAFRFMWQRQYNLRALYETPTQVADSSRSIDGVAGELIASAQGARRSLLNEVEAKRLLASYGIPVVGTEAAASADQAVAAADRMGYPVVLKICSNTITHKSDIGGVRLNLAGPAAVRETFEAIRRDLATHVPGAGFAGVTVQPMIRDPNAYELIIGSSVDPQFGPVILFGTGGQLVEVFRDRALGLPPLNTTLARRLMEQTRIFRALDGVRGRKPIDVSALADLLVRFSRLVVEQRRVKEIDINPLLVSSDRIVALDARVTLFAPDFPEGDIPRPAIRPYPLQYAEPWTMPDGEAVLIRAIRPDDEPLIVDFHRTLSERSVYLRYFHSMKLSHRISHDRLAQVCFADYDRELPMVAERLDPKTARRQIIGVARLSKDAGSGAGEFAILISDQWQGRGLGTKLLRRLIQIARDERLRCLTGSILRENIEMQRVCAELGFSFHEHRDADVLEGFLQLN